MKKNFLIICLCLGLLGLVACKGGDPSSSPSSESGLSSEIVNNSSNEGSSSSVEDDSSISDSSSSSDDNTSNGTTSSVVAQEKFIQRQDTEYTISLEDEGTVTDVIIAYRSINFLQNGNVIVISAENMPLLPNACIVTGEIMFDDGKVATFSFVSYIKEDPRLEITAPVGIVFPYVVQAKSYLLSGGDNVDKYYINVRNPYVPITIEWDSNLEAVDYYQVEYATKDDFSDSIVEICEGGENSINVYNLYKGSTYYVRVSAFDSDGNEMMSDESTFETTDLGPRVMNVDDICNVRDLGGYETIDGKTTLQGLIYRGARLWSADGSEVLTEEGKKYMSEVMNIKTEIDFRNVGESGGITESLIPNAQLVYATLGAYENAFKDTESYRQVFSMLANKSNYPVYYHCTGGADRTGTVSFLLNALLGVPEEKLIQDYEFTSWSVHLIRNTQTGVYADMYKPFRAALEQYEGDTLQKKVENYLLSIGVTETEIYNIKAIMYGEDTIPIVTPQVKFAQNVDTEFSVRLSENTEVLELYLADQKVSFVQDGATLTVAEADMPKFNSGTINGRVVLSDDRELSFKFVYEKADWIELNDYMAFNDKGMIVLNSSTSQVSGTAAVGYGTKVAVRMKSNVLNQSGGIYVMIGSYGILLRGNEIRIMQMSEGGELAETKRGLGYTLNAATFNAGEAVLFLSVDFIDDKPVIGIKILSGGQTKEFSYTYDARIHNEISSDNAKMTFQINTVDVNELIIYTSLAWKNKEGELSN